MKRLIALAIICSGFIAVDGFAARTAVRRPAGATGGATQTTTTQPATTTAARAAVTRGRTPSSGAVKTNVAGAQKQTAAAPKQTTAAPAPKKINARAATTQKVINSGTKVAGATANTVVSEECKTKFYGCMDSFCMLDNTNGGRCLCSNRHAELEKVLEDIQKLDEQSYAMATTGVERINMGESAEAVEEMVKNITNSIKTNDEDGNKTTKSKARSLNLDAWNIIDVDDDDLFGAFNDSNIENQTGDALRASVSDMCVKQIPECSPELNMLKMMYNQQIKSDCTAYENSLKQQKNASAKKLQTAQQALRETALEQHQNANKYDLGQCTIRFKQCMQTTAGCGEDFSNCASVVATDNAQTKTNGKNKKQNAKMYSIKGAVSSISIAASTYDTLLAKKPMCESVTKQCVSVKDKVWDAFMREAAPELKSAELIAESNVRMNCIGNISECFQKACKDNIDPNDPDGSYDMCLSRPETMRSLCKVQIDPCVTAEPKILDYVYARLASMRVDACTKEVKECLTDDNRCGSDYGQCIGLDTDTIINMCPSEKLTACNVDSEGKTLKQADVYANIEHIISGLMLDIDNNFLTQCQNAVNESMIKVCGNTENCDDLVIDEGAGKRSFKYEVCKYDSVTADGINWSGICRESLDAVTLADLDLPDGQGWGGKLSGTIYWGDIEYEQNDDGTFALTTQDQYIAKLKAAGHNPSPEEVQIIHDRVFGTEIKQLESAINNAIKAVEADPKVQYCMTGREVQGLGDKMIGRKKKGNGESAARFPNLTSQIREIIATSAIKNARDNYMKKYDEEVAHMMEDQVKAAEKLDKEAAVNAAEDACKKWVDNSVLPATKTPKASNAGKWIAVGVIAAVAVVGSIFTFGAAGAAGAAGIAAVLATTGGAVTAGVTVAAAGTAAALAATMTPVGDKTVDQWNYKMRASATFNRTTGECVKTTVTQNCKKTKKNYCKEWEEAKETTKTMKLL